VVSYGTASRTLELARRPRWHIHFIPTYSSWLNQVERFFGLITEKAIRRGSFCSVRELVSKIESLRDSLQQDLQALHLDRYGRTPCCKSLKDLPHESAGQDTRDSNCKRFWAVALT
jgi:DDE superfamily endonuclease